MRSGRICASELLVWCRALKHFGVSGPSYVEFLRRAGLRGFADDLENFLGVDNPDGELLPDAFYRSRTFSGADYRHLWEQVIAHSKIDAGEFSRVLLQAHYHDFTSAFDEWHAHVVCAPSILTAFDAGTRRLLQYSDATPWRLEIPSPTELLLVREGDPVDDVSGVSARTAWRTGAPLAGAEEGGQFALYPQLVGAGGVRDVRIMLPTKRYLTAKADLGMLEGRSDMAIVGDDYYFDYLTMRSRTTNPTVVIHIRHELGWLDSRCVQTNPSEHDRARRFLDVQQRYGRVLGEVARLVRDEEPGNLKQLTREDVAGSLFLNEKTMQRRLQEQSHVIWSHEEKSKSVFARIKTLALLRIWRDGYKVLSASDLGNRCSNSLGMSRNDALKPATVHSHPDPLVRFFLQGA